MIARDMPSVLTHAANALTGWDEDEFKAALKYRNIIGVIVCDKEDDTPLGCALYSLQKVSVELIYLCADPLNSDHDNLCIALLERLKTRIRDSQCRRVVAVDCPEAWMWLQRLLGTAGFKARKPTDGDKKREAYRFSWRITSDTVAV